MFFSNYILHFFSQGEAFPLILSNNILLFTLMVPLFSIFILFATSSLGNNFIYKFALGSTVFSFLLSLFL
jgi:hypothetical protein